MAIFKCKMCGGVIEFDEGSTVGICQYCGTKQTLPRISDDQRVNLYDRANHFRRNNEFDKASGLYEQILSMDTTDAEAYWSLVLCRYGVEYVEDPATHKRVPTVNRAQYTSIFDDDNYKSALEYADSSQRVIYEEEANTINEIQKGILSISQKEEPFDVFLCYKETDASGRRTPDSVLANDMYHQFTQEGFKVFFSRITLEDKLGTAYEPYIFAALNSAKVMVVLGTRPEYFNAVWVKNEWSRYLSIVNQSDGKKVLIPAYRDMDPYDLPEEFSHLQAQDMSKLGFMQDLIRGIKKIVESDAPKATVKETVVLNQGNASAAPLLRRAFMFLEDSDWAKADEFCEQVLNIEPENAQAYLGKMMAELQVRRQEELPGLDAPFDGNSNYQKALRFANAELDEFLKGCISAINEKNELARLLDIYNETTKAMNEASSESAYREVAETFKSLNDFKDADKLAKLCLDKAETIRRESVRAAEERRIKAQEAAKKRKRILRIVAPIIAVCIIFVIVLTTVIIPKMRLNEAMDLLESGKYESAYHILKEIGRNDLIENSKYERAIEMLESGNYDRAYLLLNDIDRNDLVDKSKYERATAMIESGEYEEAYSLLYGMDYKDSVDLLESIKPQHYQLAFSKVDVGDSVLFGTYEQDNNTSNGKEDIEWEVLAKEGDKLLLISHYALDCQRFNPYNDGEFVTWETCFLRRWLNETFITEAFSTGEQSIIQETKVPADANPRYSFSSGNDTTDKVFILSAAEANKYFSSDEARKCAPTEYADAMGVAISDEEEVANKPTCTYWWLRTIGEHPYYAAVVYEDGSVDNSGVDYLSGVYKEWVAVRPAIWVTVNP